MKLLMLLVSMIPSLFASLVSEELKTKITKSKEGLHLLIESPKKDGNPVGRGSYWSLRFVSFYDGDKFIGSYLIFEPPKKEIYFDSLIKIPESAIHFSRFELEERYWRMGTLMTGASLKIVEDAYADIWSARSTFLPKTREEMRNPKSENRIFLSNLRELPDYYPYLQRHVAGGIWSGLVSTSYKK